MERHFAATTYLFYEGKLVFIWHNKLNSWLPPGGHVEEKEAPHEAALREIKEEVGVTLVELFAHKPLIKFDNRTKSLPEPYRVLEEKISENHYHIDFIYLGITTEKPRNSETKTILVPEKELTTIKPVFKNVLELAYDAYKEYKKHF